MKNKEILPEILSKTSNSNITAEEFFKAFGINKVFYLTREDTVQGNDTDVLAYGFVGHLKDNHIEIDEYAGRVDKEGSRYYHDITFNYKNLIFKTSYRTRKQAIDIQNGYLVLCTSLFYKITDATLSYFYKNSAYTIKSKIEFPGDDKFIDFFKDKYGDKIYPKRERPAYICCGIPEEATDNDLLQAAKQFCRNFKITFNVWEKCKKKVFGMDAQPIQSLNELERVFRTEYPYTYNYFLTRYTVEEAIVPYLCCPQMEVLAKAGYDGLEDMLFTLWQNCQSYSKNTTSLNKFGLLVKDGNSPKEIIQMTPRLAKIMKDCKNIDQWDTFRKLDKKKDISMEFLIDMFEQGYDRTTMDKIGRILRRQYNSKNIFTQESLLNYLERLDRFEAIDRYEATTLLDDYLRMCEHLELKPKVDGDSLKREHDICARLVRNKRFADFEQGIKDHGLELKDFSYSTTSYKISPIQDYDDLIEEANTQHNCVATYAREISKKKAHIFSLKKGTNRYATVELGINSDNKPVILQAYQAYNKPVTQEATAFLNEWIDYILNTPNKLNMLQSFY